MKDIIQNGKNNKIHWKIEQNTKNKVRMNAKKVHVYMWLHTTLIKSTDGNKLGFS